MRGEFQKKEFISSQKINDVQKMSETSLTAASIDDQETKKKNDVTYSSMHY